MGSKRNVLLINVNYWSHLDRGDAVGRSSVHLCTVGPSRGYLVLFQFGDHFGEPSSFVLPSSSSAGGSGRVLGPWGLYLVRVGVGRTPPSQAGTLGATWSPPLPGDAFWLCKGSFWRSQGLAARLPLILPAGKQEACLGCRGNGRKLC